MHRAMEQVWALSSGGQQICYPMSTGLVGRAASRAAPEVVSRAKDMPEYNPAVDLKLAQCVSPSRAASGRANLT